ncbi:MAG: hypothetical protein ACRDHZ_10930 [Ktedonobacteraceae bacterium]
MDVLPREEVIKLKAFGLLPSLRSSKNYLLGLLVFLSLLTLSACGGGNAVGIYDHAGVLHVSQVKRAASHLPNNVDVYTTSTFNGTRADFQRTTTAKLRSDPNRIVMAIDTTRHYMYIARGSNVPLSGAGILQAVSTFASNYRGGDYTGATVAALGSMKSTLNAQRGPAYSPLLLCCLPLLVLSLIPVGLKIWQPDFFRRFPRHVEAPRGPSPYQQPPQPGYPHDQGDYGPPPPQHGGMNPWAAGGLGAAAGGLAGYELGRQQGEHHHDNDGGGSFGQDGGNANGGDFGSGSDFDSDFSDGGEFGGGDNFGGGGDFGDGGGNL